MKKLENLSAKEVLRLAREESGLTVKEIATELNLSPSSITRYFKEGDEYYPSMLNVVSLSTTFGNPLLYKWIEAKCQKGKKDLRSELLSAVETIERACHEVRFLAEEKKVPLTDPELKLTVLKLIPPYDSIRKMLLDDSGLGKKKKNKPKCPLLKFWKE